MIADPLFLSLVSSLEEDVWNIKWSKMDEVTCRSMMLKSVVIHHSLYACQYIRYIYRSGGGRNSKESTTSIVEKYLSLIWAVDSDQLSTL